MDSAKPETPADDGGEKKPVEIDQWVINSPEKVKVLGCGDSGSNLILRIYKDYPSILAGIQYLTVNKPTKPDYLDLKLTPDLRNIRAASVRNEGENSFDISEKSNSQEDGPQKSSVMNKLKSFIGSRQKIEIDAEINEQRLAEARAAEELTDQRDLIVRNAISELTEELNEFLKNTDLLFIVSDFKSSFGLDNSLRAAEIAKKEEIITVGIVILPTKLDKLEDVEYGNRVLQSFRLKADIVFVIPNIEHIIDGYLVLTISELIELMTTSGLVNLDVADVKNVVGDGNVAMLGFGSGRDTDHDKITGAINEVVHSPLLNIDLDGVTRTLVSVVGDRTMTVTDAQKAARVILEKIQPGARLIWGAGINSKLAGAIKVMVMIGVKPKNILVHIYANS
jgi:cell division GTPase FtsZ